MKITRYRNPDGRTGYAGATDDHEFFALKGDLFGGFEMTGEKVTIEKQLAPIDPPIIMAIGLNYRQHAEESGLPAPEYPILFIKPGSAVQHPRDPIVLPATTKKDEVDYECELAVVIGKTCKNASREEALDYVLGYTCANDVSARDWQLKKGGGQWCRGKSFDTFAPLGPCLVTADEIPNPNDLRIRTVLNGDTVQDWNTRDMIFDVPSLIAFLSEGTTLQPGTVIMTGTPQGVGMARKPPVWLKAGDSVTVIIENIGALTNPVIEE
jgi:2-keto-4-pentenoate hydratase/2-oxohepta-3-ene-1,7-dioic acid hydratase in catechol pathway